MQSLFVFHSVFATFLVFISMFAALFVFHSLCYLLFLGVAGTHFHNETNDRWETSLLTTFGSSRDEDEA